MAMPADHAPPDIGRWIHDPNVAANMARHGSLKIVLCPSVTVRRRWTERLFTRPWRPQEGTRRSSRQPGPNQCYLQHGQLFMGEVFHGRVIAILHPERPHVGKWQERA
jgi:hypothetical protein